MKQFNTTAVCIPSKHYMVDLSERVKEIKTLVDDGKYFTINRARQYGKTTTLTALDSVLSIMLCQWIFKITEMIHFVMRIHSAGTLSAIFVHYWKKGLIEITTIL